MITLALAAIGLAAGLIGGLMGIGGSLIMIPAMTEVIGPNQHLYQAAAMIVNMFVALPAVYQHRRARAVDGPAVRKLLPLTVIAVVVGVLVSESPLLDGAQGEPYLRALFGAFLFAMVAGDLYRIAAAPIRRRQEACPDHGEARQKLMSWRRSAAVAVPTGLIAGLLGVGGGALAVPLQRRFLRIGMTAAIANSATVMIGTAAVGATVKNYAYAGRTSDWARPLLLAAVLIPTAVGGSLVGSRLTHRLPVRAVKGAFLILLLVLAVRLTGNAYLEITAH